jgi:ceramide glucosyltransferase
LYGFFANSAAWASAACDVAAAFGCVYAIGAAWIACGFVRSAAAPAATYPAVTILKPLHGTEPNLYGNLAGFCRQDYPGPVQIVFGVDDAADPAIDVVHRLIADFPGCDLALLINSRRHGANRKVSSLIGIAEKARHELLVVSDSDIAVAPDYLKSIAAAFERPGVGLVTCLYGGVAATGIWGHLAAAAIDYHFLPSVLVGLKLGLATPCFGATVALRKTTLAEIGGFEAVVDQLADDYALGALLRSTGQTVAIPNHIVAHVCADRSIGQLFLHELRWARTIRAIDPVGFPGLALTHATPFALLGLLLGGGLPAGLLVVAAIGCRFLLQSEIDRAFRLRGAAFWLGPLRDILSFVIFVGSFFGRSVEWRGHRYGLRAGNRLAYYGEVET